MRHLRWAAFALVLMTMGAAACATSAFAASAGPTCAEGPQTVANVTTGTPCADVIFAPAGVETVRGGAGDDTIIAAPLTAATPFPGEEWLGVGSQTFEGGPGDDVVFGERGNDTLSGNEGNDRLFGGIGDDVLRGGPGQDQLAGGHGADSIDGDAGDDYVRGDGTIDRIFDTGGGTDTLSYSTGITPAFGGDMSAFPGFPPPGGERGVRLNLGAAGQNGENGTASFGGGVDEVEGPAFERVIGTAFSDYIVGSAGAETIYGGGGADVIIGEGGNDTLSGGADGDHLDGAAGSADSLDGGPGEDHCEDGETLVSCAAKGGGVVTRDTAKISVGAPLASGAAPRSQLYLVGSTAADLVTATYAAGSPPSVTFEADAASTGSFDASPSAAGGCDSPTGSSPEKVVCTLSSPLESIVIAGMAGADELDTTGFPATVSVILLGGAGNDDLLGGDATEDVLVDGDASAADADLLTALGRDDALIHNAGADTRLGGDGNDLFLSSSICAGDALRGEGGRDNSSWTRLSEPVQANLELGLAGRPGGGAVPQCGAEQTDALQTIEDLEGNGSSDDVLYGSSGPNQLLGWEGSDDYFAEGGDDTILANSGDSDGAIDCGGGNDRALVDLAGKGHDDPSPTSCEQVEEAAINSFRFQLPPPPPPDETPPETSISSGPAEGATIDDSSPTFEFTSSEAGSTFECAIDAGSFTSCTSPHTTTPLTDGAHTFFVRATDAADNTDATPASRGFSVDTSSPETAIDSGPAGATDDPTPTFAFSSEAGASFECQIDGGGFSLCSSPFTTPALADGPHTFEVRAKDAGGKTDATPATRSFTVAMVSFPPPDDPAGGPTIPNPPPPNPPPEALPSNAFSFGKLTRNGRNGTASLVVFVPGPGELGLQGRGLREATRLTDSAGPVTLPIRPRRGLMIRLRRQGSASVIAVATYLPDRGVASSRTRTFRLFLSNP